MEQERQDKGKGKIFKCSVYSKKCHYRCCNQAKPEDIDFSPKNSLLLYPGELKIACSQEKSNQHIVISGNYKRGNLAYCNFKSFNQSQCTIENNFKPLDCLSYPFFPFIINDCLELSIDVERCPLSNNFKILFLHYRYIKQEWEKVIFSIPEVKRWIKQIGLLDGYVIVNESDMV
jgi:hypothetical protein